MTDKINETIWEYRKRKAREKKKAKEKKHEYILG